MEKKNYLFNSSLDGISKCLFTVIPIVLAFHNMLDRTKNPLDTRISFFVAIFSLFFYYILEFQRVKPRYIKVLIFFSFIFLSISYVLVIIVFGNASFRVRDFYALIAFIIAICPLLIQTVIVFIQIDLGFAKKNNENKMSRTLRSIPLNKKSGKLTTACKYL